MLLHFLDNDGIVPLLLQQQGYRRSYDATTDDEDADHNDNLILVSLRAWVCCCITRFSLLIASGTSLLALIDELLE